jgi:hypothetical protein
VRNVAGASEVELDDLLVDASTYLVRQPGA